MKFFDQVTFLEARAVVTDSFTAPSREEMVAITQAVGRVTAAPVTAAFDVPGEDRCLMDGCAVRSAETTGARDQHPIALPDAVPVESGEPLPPGFDAVVMLEDLEWDGTVFTTKRAARPGQHVRRIGAEVREGAPVIPAGHRIPPDEIGALVACGVERVLVRALRVALLPVGQGLVPPGTRPGPGEVIESNTTRTSAFLSGRGVDCRLFPAVPGTVREIRAALAAATAGTDLVLVFGGISKGTNDGAAGAIQAEGEVLFHGIAMQPGRPTLAGRVRGVPVIALPGYPFAAGVVLRELVAPLLCAWGFPPAVTDPMIQVELARTVTSEVGVDEFVPLTLGYVSGRWVAYPRQRAPASHLADIGPHAFLHIPGHVEGYEAGTVQDVRLVAGERVIGRTLLVHGEAGPLLDRLVSTACGEGWQLEAIGGRDATAREAVRAGHCHLAFIVKGGDATLIAPAAADQRLQSFIQACGPILIEECPMKGRD